MLSTQPAREGILAPSKAFFCEALRTSCSVKPLLRKAKTLQQKYLEECVCFLHPFAVLVQMSVDTSNKSVRRQIQVEGFPFAGSVLF